MGRHHNHDNPTHHHRDIRCHFQGVSPLLLCLNKRAKVSNITMISMSSMLILKILQLYMSLVFWSWWSVCQMPQELLFSQRYSSSSPFLLSFQIEGNILLISRSPFCPILFSVSTSPRIICNDNHRYCHWWLFWNENDVAWVWRVCFGTRYTFIQYYYSYYCV